MLALTLARLRNDDRAVSPVVGVVLMVGIAVALAAMVALMVFGMGSGLNEPVPNADIEFDTHVESGTSFVSVSHDGGETISKENTQRVNVQIVRDGSRAGTAPWAGVQDLGAPQYVWLENNQVTAGTPIDFSVTTDTRTLNPGDELQVVWISPSGGNSEVIGEYTVPGETEKTLSNTCLINGSVVDMDYAGSGTSADPYQITNVTQLQCTVEEPSASYEVVNDIDASQTSGWNNGAGFRPVENFNGELRGQGYTINDLYIDRPSETEVGIFGTVDGAYVGGVNVQNPDVTGGRFTGAVAGELFTSTVSGVNVNGGSVFGNGNVGGVAGFVANAQVDTVSSSVYVDSSGRVAGGVFGLVNDGSTVTGIDAYAPVQGTHVVGGAVGVLKQNSVLSNAHAEGTVTATDQVYGSAGGLVGKVSELATVESSSAVGDVTGSWSVGGAVGEVGNTCTVGSNTDCTAPDSVTFGATVTGVSAEGNVSGGEYYTGGFVGAIYENTTVENSYSTGDVTGTNETGGFVGFIVENDVVRSSWSSSSVDASGHSVGGFAGMVQDAVVKESYATGAVSGDGWLGGFAGYATGGAVENSYAHSPVTADAGSGGDKGGENVAGFVGRVGDGNTGTSVSVTDVYATGAVSPGSASNVGGAVGYAAPDGSHSFSGVYWDTESTGVSTGEAGSGLTTSEMQDTNAESNMPEFDWANVWDTVTGDYPDLSWQ